MSARVALPAVADQVVVPVGADQLAVVVVELLAVVAPLPVLQMVGQEADRAVAQLVVQEFAHNSSKIQNGCQVWQPF